MKLIGHRGSKNELPENTLLGFKHAIELGLDGIELDVHCTKDGELVVIHDPTLNRTTNGDGLVNDFTLSELRSLDAGSGELIPTLDEAIDLVIAANKKLFLEAKDLKTAEKILEIIPKRDLYDQCTVICFDHYFVKSIKERNPKINTGVIIASAPVGVVDLVHRANADCVVCAIRLIRSEMVSDCKKAGVPVAVYNANTKEEFERMKTLEIDYVMTDRPKFIKGLL